MIGIAAGESALVRSRSKTRLAVWRCLRGTFWSSSSQCSIVETNAICFGRRMGIVADSKAVSTTTAPWHFGRREIYDLLMQSCGGGKARGLAHGALRPVGVTIAQFRKAADIGQGHPSLIAFASRCHEDRRQTMSAGHVGYGSAHLQLVDDAIERRQPILHEGVHIAGRNSFATAQNMQPACSPQATPGPALKADCTFAWFSTIAAAVSTPPIRLNGLLGSATRRPARASARISLAHGSRNPMRPVPPATRAYVGIRIPRHLQVRQPSLARSL